MTIICQECGQELPTKNTKHPFEDCAKYRTKLFLKGLSKAHIYLSEKQGKAFINIPLAFPKSWIIIEARVEKRTKEV